MASSLLTSQALPAYDGDAMELELAGFITVFDFMLQCAQRMFQQVMYKLIRTQMEFGYKKSKNNFNATEIYFANRVT